MRPEHWLFTIPLRLRSLFRWAQADQELDDELRDHLERKTQEYVAQGMTQEEAHRRARLDLEGIEQTKEKCRDARRVNWIQDFVQDLHYGLRMLRKSPGFAAVAVLTLALGVGANTAIFSFIDAVLLRSIPVKDPQGLVVFNWTARAHPKLQGQSGYGDCADQTAIGDCSFSIPFYNTVRAKYYRSKDRVADPTNWWVVILARLKPGLSIGEAQADATTIFRNEMLYGVAPLSKPEDAPAITLRPARSGLNGETSQIAPALYVTMVIVAFILLIACANVAGLTLARSASRQKEIAVRLALGAGRARIIRQLLTESVLLAVAGGALGVLVAVWGVDAIASLLSNGSGEPFPFAVAPDWRVLLFTLAITFLTGILFGLAPSLRRSRVDLTPSLKENASSLPGAAAHTGRRFRLGDGLVVGQVALSMVVLVGAGLLVRTLRNLRAINPGFDAQNILLFGLDPALAGYTDQQTQQLYSNLQQRFAALPGVISVSYSEDALLAGGWAAGSVHVDGAPPKQYANAGELPVGLNFFSTMRIPILAGRSFTSADFASAAATNAAQKARDADAENANPASSPASPSPTALDEAYYHSAPVPIVVNESFVREYLENKSPVGVHVGNADRGDIPNPGPGYTIVGVVGDTKYAQLRRKTAPIIVLQ